MATTPGISWIQLPNGYCFPLELQKGIEVQGINLVLSDVNGGSKSIPFDTSAGANIALKEVIAVMTTPITFTALPPLITRIIPADFNAQTDTITIQGFGFSQAAAGFLWIEDATGGEDSNGLSMTCTVIDDNTMTAVFNNTGDGNPYPNLAPGPAVAVLVYYQNAANTQSNAINATEDDAYNIITMT